MMEVDPRVPPYHTSDKTSFAYTSAKDRWPVIVTGAIDDVHRSAGDAKDETTREEGKRIVESLGKLKYEMQHDRQLTPLDDDGQPDIAGYNEELKRLGAPTWFNVPWLYSECYLYRRIATIFALSTNWKSYDIFSRQKLSTFKSSRPAVFELAARYKDILSQLDAKSDSSANSKSSDSDSTPRNQQEQEQAEQILFTEMCEICLWGNATDLSLLTNLSYDDIQKLQGSEARKNAEKNIIANDLPKAFAALKKAQKEEPQGERRVDIILDNAGFELFVDLILAGYLLASNLATTIILHPKSIPWFVSDVIPADFSALLNALADPQSFYASLDSSSSASSPKPNPLSEFEISNLTFLFENWSTLHAEGNLVIRPNRFWTHAGSYWRLPTKAPDLYSDLSESELVIFKGDLNYRKLTGDVMWDPTISFSQAVGPLAGTRAPSGSEADGGSGSGSGSEAKGIRVLALRTCKADVVVGLSNGEDERLRAMEGGGGDSGARKWAWSGKWAVVQFCDGKSG